MRHITFLPCLLAAGMAIAACDSDDNMPGGRPGQEQTQTVDFEGSYWECLVDSPQYMGHLLYGDGTYSWRDEATTLSGKLTDAWGDGMFWGGGVAISDYVDARLDTLRSYDAQLAVPRGNGSRRFAVVYCDADLTFADGRAREVKAMDIIGTTYSLSVAMRGDGWAKALTGKGDHMEAVITGYDGERRTGSVTVTLALEGSFLTEWHRADLTPLGAVTRLSMTMDGSDKSGGLVKAPAYFAIDNVTVGQPR